jgi:hypothetical protein
MTIRTWPYNSSERLAIAGFRCRGPIQCPICGDEIVIYQRTGQMPVFLDPETFQPHLAAPQHADPPWHPAVDGKSAAAGER